MEASVRVAEEPVPRPMRVAVGLFILLAPLFSGCSEEATSFEYTMLARVDSHYDAALCEGDRRKIDRRIDRVAEALGLEPDQIQIALYPGAPVPGCNSPFGCYSRGVARATHQSLDHEIVHAVAAPLGDTRKLWSEGLAEALSGAFLRRTWNADATVVTEWGATKSADLDYTLAGHFAKWIIETRGVDAYLRLYAGEDVESVLGVPLDEISAEYVSVAPWGYSSEACLESTVAVVFEDHTEDFEIDCDIDGIRHLIGVYPDSVALSKNLELEESGTYAVSLGNGWGFQVLRCLPSVVPEEEPRTDGRMIYHDADVLPPIPVLLGSEENLLEFEAGVYRFTVFGTAGVGRAQASTGGMRLLLRSYTPTTNRNARRPYRSPPERVPVLSQSSFRVLTLLARRLRLRALPIAGQPQPSDLLLVLRFQVRVDVRGVLPPDGDQAVGVVQRRDDAAELIPITTGPEKAEPGVHYRRSRFPITAFEDSPHGAALAGDRETMHEQPQRGRGMLLAHQALRNSEGQRHLAGG